MHHSFFPCRRMVDLVEGLVVWIVVGLVAGEDTEAVASWPPRVCPLPLRCRREDRSVGQSKECVCVRVCMCACVHVFRDTSLYRTAS